jgi:putative PIN family toxin of toxin-antitoxin system
MRVVLDTCILFSALRSSAGASYRVLSALPKKRFTPVVSTPLFFEYEEVLCRPRQFPHLGRQDVDDFLDYFASMSEFQRVDFLWRPFLSDPDDDLVLEVAVAGRVDAIVTYNLKDFQGCDRLGMRTITPQRFIEESRL